jgi:hypothetical protein
MDTGQQPQADADPQNRRIATAVGLALVAMGVAGVLWIGQQLFALADGPQNVPLVGKFLSFDSAARTLIISSEKIELPEGLYFAVGLFIFLLALIVAASLAKALISIGASLLGNDVAKVMDRLRNEIGSMKRTLESRNK